MMINQKRCSYICQRDKEVLVKLSKNGGFMKFIYIQYSGTSSWSEQLWTVMWLDKSPDGTNLSPNNGGSKTVWPRFAKNFWYFIKNDMDVNSRFQPSWLQKSRAASEEMTPKWWLAPADVTSMFPRFTWKHARKIFISCIVFCYTKGVKLLPMNTLK